MGENNYLKLINETIDSKYFFDNIFDTHSLSLKTIEDAGVAYKLHILKTDADKVFLSVGSCYSSIKMPENKFSQKETIEVYYTLFEYNTDIQIVLLLQHVEEVLGYKIPELYEKYISKRKYDKVTKFLSKFDHSSLGCMEHFDSSEISLLSKANLLYGYDIHSETVNGVPVVCIHKVYIGGSKSATRERFIELNTELVNTDIKYNRDLSSLKEVVKNVQSL